jgi:hypothetical protein
VAFCLYFHSHMGFCIVSDHVLVVYYHRMA